MNRKIKGMSDKDPSDIPFFIYLFCAVEKTEAPTQNLC